MTYPVAVAGGTDCNFVWTIDGESLSTFAAGGAADDARVARTSGANDQTLEFRALDNASHLISVAASCSTAGGTCTGTAFARAQQCMGATSEAIPERKAKIAD
jgi:hypothetical protein